MAKLVLSELEETILGILSFYEKMDFSKIVLDLNQEFIQKYPQFHREELEGILKKLQQKKLIKIIKEKGDTFYLRVQKKRSLWKKLLVFFSDVFRRE